MPYQVRHFCVLDFKISYGIITVPIKEQGGASVELSELTAYAGERYQMQEQHKWADFPGFSVLCHPRTGKWVALLMRQWDTETGTELQRCDLKCGGESLTQFQRPYLLPPIRMKGNKWVDIVFDDSTEREVVFHLFDRAITAGNGHGCTIVLSSAPIADEAGYWETALPRSGSGHRPEQERLPEKLREMRRLFAYGRESAEARAKNFYRQAVFMQEYEDDCPWQGEFSCYFPTYHDLTVQQLRGYFTWRAGVRRGDYQPIPASAAYIYIYELLNGVGADSPEDALNKLRAFETGYLDSGVGDARIRTNLRRWMLEYAVVNDLPPTLAREVADSAMIERDEALAVLRAPNDRPDADVFAALCALGDKKLAASPVISGDAARGMRLFAESWRCALARFQPERGDLFTFLFGERRTYDWNPFSNAVYWEHERHADCDYVLGECRSYRCRDGFWQTERFDSLYFDRDRLLGFLHLADLKLRRYLQTGRYLRERAGEAWAAPYIDAAIEADRSAVLEAARPKITIDLSGLEQIRADAAATRDSLLTEEERDEPEALAVTPVEEMASDLPLDAVQLQIVRALLRGEEAAGLLKENHLMPSMTADFINEALFDEIGDTVVTCEDDRLTLVEDYREDLAQLLGGTGDGGA